MCREQHAKALDKAVFPGLQGGPHQQQTAAIAVALGEAATPAFSDYAHIVANAKVLAEALAERGFTLVSGGTDNHLILIDMTSKGVSGKEASTALSPGGDRHQRERDPVRSAQAVRSLRRADRHPGGDHPRSGREHMGEIARWFDEVVGAVRERRERAARARQGRGAGSDGAVPRSRLRLLGGCAVGLGVRR